MHLKNITLGLAMKLRLRPVTENILDMTQLDPAFEEFSQHQSMTNRIKEILREYPVDGPVLFQEQIQNSEDAGELKCIDLASEPVCCVTMTWVLQMSPSFCLGSVK